MKKKLTALLICGLIAVEALTLNQSHAQQEQIQVLKAANNRNKTLTKIANQVATEQEALLLNYKNELIYCENQISLLEAQIEDETFKKQNLREIVFTASDIRVPSNATSEELASALEGTKLEHLAPAYIKLEQDYGWNAIAAASITAHETYWGEDYKVDDYNNLGGIRERSGDYWIFNSQEECIDYIGSLIARKYLNSNGEYFNGYSLKAINAMYCPVGGDTWANSVTQIASSLVDKIESIK